MYDTIASYAVPLFIGASFTGGVCVFFLVMIRTIRRRKQIPAE